MKIVAQTERTQFGNKKIVIEKFKNLVEKAFTEPKKRIPITISEEEKEKRLREKKMVAEKKQRRKKNEGE